MGLTHCDKTAVFTFINSNNTIYKTPQHDESLFVYNKWSYDTKCERQIKEHKFKKNSAKHDILSTHCSDIR